MSTIEEHIQASLAEILGNLSTSPKIQEKLEKAIDESVNAAVNDLFSYNGPMRKAIAEKVKEACGFDPSVIDLPNYQAIIAQTARAAYISSMEAMGVNQTEAIISQIIGAPEAGPLKFSKLVDLLKESEWIDDDDDGHDVTVHAEKPEYSARWIYMDFKEAVSKYNCRFRLLIGKDGIISNLRIDEADRRISHKCLELGVASKIETVLVNAYITKRPIEFDEEAEDMDLLVRGENVKARDD